MDGNSLNQLEPNKQVWKADSSDDGRNAQQGHLSVGNNHTKAVICAGHGMLTTFV